MCVPYPTSGNINDVSVACKRSWLAGIQGPLRSLPHGDRSYTISLSLAEDSGPLARMAHVVICVSMKIRMNTRTAGSRLATIIHTGKGLFSPRGLMTQPRLSGAVTENPLGTLSFCKAEGVCCYRGYSVEHQNPRWWKQPSSILLLLVQCLTWV